MSVSYLISHFPIENVSLNTISLFWVVIWLVEFLFLHVIINREVKIKKNQDFELSNRLPCCNEKKEDGHLCGEDVEKVMARLGIYCHPEGEKLQESLDSDDLSNLFEEKEPSLDEVKGAFDVFDENGDGFIDARELQRVLCNLGFKDGLEMENCKRMIGAFDKNGDGRIDFNEFVKFMESTFC